MKVTHRPPLLLPVPAEHLAGEWDRLACLELGTDACKERRISADGDFSGLTRYGDDVVNNPIYGLKATSVRVPAPPLGV